MVWPNYVAVQITLTLADTNYNVLALVRAVEEACPASARELCLESDKANDAASKIMIGDSNLSGTRYGYQLSPGDSRTYRAMVQNVPFGVLYARSASAGLKLNVEVMAA